MVLMLCWNLPVNDRWSSLSPLGLCCSFATLTRAWYCISNTNNTDSLWLSYCKQTFSLQALAEASCMLSPHSPSLSLKNTHICTQRPPPTQSRTHSNTQNKHTDSTQHSTHCNNFRGMVSMWRGCGKRVGREVGTGEGSTLWLLLTPKRLVISHVVSRGAGSTQYKLMGTCVFRVHEQPPIVCRDVGKPSFHWTEARLHPGRGRHEASHAAFPSAELSWVSAD